MERRGENSAVPEAWLTAAGFAFHGDGSDSKPNSRQLPVCYAIISSVVPNAKKKLAVVWACRFLSHFRNKSAGLESTVNIFVAVAAFWIRL